MGSRALFGMVFALCLMVQASSATQSRHWANNHFLHNGEADKQVKNRGNSPRPMNCRKRRIRIIWFMNRRARRVYIICQPPRMIWDQNRVSDEIERGMKYDELENRRRRMLER